MDAADTGQYHHSHPDRPWHHELHGILNEERGLHHFAGLSPFFSILLLLVFLVEFMENKVEGFET